MDCSVPARCSLSVRTTSSEEANAAWSISGAARSTTGGGVDEEACVITDVPLVTLSTEAAKATGPSSPPLSSERSPDSVSRARLTSGPTVYVAVHSLAPSPGDMVTASDSDVLPSKRTVGGSEATLSSTSDSTTLSPSLACPPKGAGRGASPVGGRTEYDTDSAPGPAGTGGAPAGTPYTDKPYRSPTCAADEPAGRALGGSARSTIESELPPGGSNTIHE